MVSLAEASSGSAARNSSEKKKGSVSLKESTGSVSNRSYSSGSSQKASSTKTWGSGFFYGTKGEQIQQHASEFRNTSGAVTLDTAESAVKKARSQGVAVSYDRTNGKITAATSADWSKFEAIHKNESAEYASKWSAALNSNPVQNAQNTEKRGTLDALKEGWNAGQGRSFSLNGLTAPKNEVSETSKKLQARGEAFSTIYDKGQQALFRGSGVLSDIARGITNVPQMLVETVTEAPTGIETIMRNPTTSRDAVLFGLGATAGGITKKATEHPGELAGELVGFWATGKSGEVAKVAVKKTGRSVRYGTEIMLKDERAELSSARIKPVTESKKSVSESWDTNPFGSMKETTVERVRTREVVREKQRGELGRLQDEIVELTGLSNAKERSIKASSKSSNPLIREAGRETAREQMEIEFKLDLAKEKYDRIHAEKYEIGKNRAERLRAEKAAQKEREREREIEVERSSSKSKSKDVTALWETSRVIEASVSVVNPFVSIREKSRSVELSGLEIQVERVGERSKSRTVVRQTERTREREKETEKEVEKEVEREREKEKEREKEREKEKERTRERVREKEKESEKMLAAFSTRTKKPQKDNSTKFGKKKKTLKNKFGSFNQYNKAMAKVSKNPFDTKKHKKSNSSNLLKKLKW